MFKSLTRGVSAVVLSALALGGESRACCFSHCFGWCHPAPAPTFTQYAAPACNVCPQTVSYVPTTACAPVCAPCSSCQPVTACDPCGGAPMATFVHRPVMMPVTTFRPVVSQMNFPAPACPACSGAAYYSPSYAGTAYQPAAAYAGTAVAAPALAPAAAGAPGCPTCGGGAATTYGASAATYAAPAQGYAPGPVVPPAGAPMISAPAPAAGGAVPGPTFDQGSAPAATSSAMPQLSPIPDADKLNSNSAPRLMDPQSRTTSARPLMGPANVTPAIFNVADRANVFHPASVPAAYQTTVAKPITAPLPADGWSVGAPTSTYDDGFQSAGGR
jgi:hypothetical protein